MVLKREGREEEKSQTKKNDAGSILIEDKSIRQKHGVRKREAQDAK